MLLLSFFGCPTTQSQFFETCDLQLEVPDSVSPGEVVIVDGGPVTEPLDTLVLLDGNPLPVEDVDRTTNCLVCDSCKADAECLTCGTCLSCTTICESCVETTIVRIPEDQPPGTFELNVTNGFGSGSVELSVAASQDDASEP